VAVIIGAKEGEREKTQIWIDKERFIPLRYLAVSGEKDRRHFREVRYLDYQGTGGKHRWLPRKIEVWEDGRPVRISEVKDIRGLTKIDRKRFDLEALRRLAREQSTSQPASDDAAPPPAPAP
jgi:outer membrane lipoprotein-sorting protein